jgi:hypothetical protein
LPNFPDLFCARLFLKRPEVLDVRKRVRMLSFSIDGSKCGAFQ